MANPECVADTDDDCRTLQHRRENREGKHLLVTDQHCGALVIDFENARGIKTKGHTYFAERPPHADWNRHSLVKLRRFRADNQHRVVDGFRAWLDWAVGDYTPVGGARRTHPLKSVDGGTEVVCSQIAQSFQDVSNALVGYQKFREFREQQERLVVASRDAVKLSNMRYEGGYSAYLEVLTNQTNLFSSELTLASAREEEMLSLVQLYNALGGGWQQ